MPSITAIQYKDFNLLEFQERFVDENSCWEYFYKMRWPTGFICEKCAGKASCVLTKRKLIQCNKCKQQVSCTSGTIFHKSRAPLQKWFWMIFLIATSKKGVSMLYLQKQLGIKSYKTVWLMVHKIRKAMAERNDLYSLHGVAEVDEIFIGGKQAQGLQRKNGSNKTPFLIAVQEDFRGNPRYLSFEELESIYEEHIVKAVEKTIAKNSKIKSDGRKSYAKITQKGYEHDPMNASKYPRETHEHLRWINTITSNLKRYLLSTHHGAFPKYRKAFLEEFAWRFNRRFWPYQTFDRLLNACIYCEPMSLDELTA